MPSEGTEHRKLAAIMFTDMVGYSALSQRNEALALELLAENQRLLRTQFPLFNGREVKSTGDGFLVEFPSALDATRCAVEIQRAIATRNGAQPRERHIQVRIGIHVGDVVHREADMYGDGVNIAARIEPLAVGGGICLSDAVYAQVRNKLDMGLTKLDSPELRHIEVPMDVYRVLLPWQQQAPAVAKPLSQSRSKPIPRALAVGLTVALVLGAAAWWLVHQSGNETKQVAIPSTNAPTRTATIGGTTQKSVAVLPFVNMSADKADEYLSDGMTEELVNALTKVKGLRVPGRSSAFAFKGKNEDDIFRRVGEQLHVNTVLEGSVRKAGNKLRITAQLINVADGFHLWSETYDRDMTDIFAIQTDVAQRVATALKGQLGVEEAHVLSKKPTENLEAYNLYRQGCEYYEKWSEENYSKALAFFQQAIEKDPRFALAYSRMADNYVVAADLYLAPREAFSKAKDAAQKAIELDDNLGEAHASLGMVHYHYDWDWAAAEKEFKRALALDPQSSNSHTLYAEYLAGMRRFDEAYDQGRQAVSNDPFSPFAKYYLGEALFFAGRSDQAIQELSKAVELGPKFGWARTFLGRSYLIKGMQQRAIEEMEANFRASSNDSIVLGFLGYGYAVTGRRADALKSLQILDEMEKRRWVSRLARVYIYAGLGDKDKAFEWLEKAYQDRADSLAWFRNEPESKSLQTDPRFAALMRKIGFTEQ